jgi:polysaccharide biosynthesis protein PslH
MNILYLCHKYPFPLTDGGRIVVYQTIKQLTKDGNRVFLAVLTPQPELQDLEAIKRICHDLIILSINDRYTLWLAIKNLFTRSPINIYKYHKKNILNKIYNFANDKSIDIISVEQLHMAYYGLALKEKLRKPTVLRQQNLEMNIMQRFSEQHKNPFIKWYAKAQSFKFQLYEPRICSKFDHCIMITHEDELALRKLTSNVKTSVITAGVDIDYFIPIFDSGEENTITYIGNFDWWPNVHGLLHFINNIFPLILKVKPDIKLLIFGRNPDHQIKALHDNNHVFVKGYVEHIRDAFHSAKVIVVPLYVGSGIRIKILEGMASGKAIVTTSIGCEGIDTYSKECFFIADTDEDFAKKTCLLLDDQNRRITLGKNSSTIIKQHYSWDAIGKRFMGLYNKLLI